MSAFDDERPVWMLDANCRGEDIDVFFVGRGEDNSTAKAICRGCNVQAECLAHAINTGERFGIWGGLNEKERRGIRRVRRLKVVA